MNKNFTVWDILKKKLRKPLICFENDNWKLLNFTSHLKIKIKNEIQVFENRYLQNFLYVNCQKILKNKSFKPLNIRNQNWVVMNKFKF